MVDYCDYSRVTSTEEALLLSQQVNPTRNDWEDALVTVPATRADPNFPTRLHYALSDSEKDGLSHIVSWRPHGRCFHVHKPEEFVDQILRRWFRQNKLTSFQRQLNIYGFTRITSGPDKNGWYHERFLRGKLFLTHGLPRMPVKGNRTRRSTTDRNEPNFYDMPFLPISDTQATPVVASTSTTHTGLPTVSIAGGPNPSLALAVGNVTGDGRLTMDNLDRTSLLSMLQSTVSRPSVGSAPLVATALNILPNHISTAANMTSSGLLPSQSSPSFQPADYALSDHPIIGVLGPNSWNGPSAMSTMGYAASGGRQLSAVEQLVAAEYLAAHRRRRQSRTALAILTEAMNASPPSTALRLRDWYHHRHHQP